jgi:hypothetical protein
LSLVDSTTPYILNSTALGKVQLEDQ